LQARCQGVRGEDRGVPPPRFLLRLCFRHRLYILGAWRCTEFCSLIGPNPEALRLGRGEAAILIGSAQTRRSYIVVYRDLLRPGARKSKRLQEHSLSLTTPGLASWFWLSGRRVFTVRGITGSGLGVLASNNRWNSPFVALPLAMRTVSTHRTASA